MSHEDPGGRKAQYGARLFDQVSLQRRLGGDEVAAAAVLMAFARDAPRQLARLRDALERDEIDQIRLMAHTLKGSLLWIGADEAASAASVLEQAVSGDKRVSPREGLAAFSERVEQLVVAIRVAT